MMKCRVLRINNMLYIVNEEDKIRPGDWYVFFVDTNTFEIFPYPVEQPLLSGEPYNFMFIDCAKIIASTDKRLGVIGIYESLHLLTSGSDIVYLHCVEQDGKFTYATDIEGNVLWNLKES